MIFKLEWNKFKNTTGGSRGEVCLEEKFASADGVQTLCGHVLEVWKLRQIVSLVRKHGGKNGIKKLHVDE